MTFGDSPAKESSIHQIVTDKSAAHTQVAVVQKQTENEEDMFSHQMQMAAVNSGSPGSRRKREDRKTIDGPNFARQFSSFQSGTVVEPDQQRHQFQQTTTAELTKTGHTGRVRTIHKSMSYSAAATSSLTGSPLVSRPAVPHQYVPETTNFAHHHRTSAIKQSM